MNNKFSINYLYFGFLFISLATLHISHLYLIEEGDAFRFFFVVDAFLQSFVEVGALVFLYDLCRKYFPEPISLLAIEFSFLLLLVRILDFPLERLMSTSIWFFLDILSQEKVENFIEMLLASNISFSVWFAGGLVVVFLLVLSLGLFFLTDAVVRKRPLFLTYGLFCKVSCGAFALLILWDGAETCFTYRGAGDFYCKALPWKRTFFLPKTQTLNLPATLKEPPEQQEIFKAIDENNLVLREKPDIFLFVAESLREDFMTPEIAPHFYRFKEENQAFKLAFSNANATQMAWFSLFYSQYPFYWCKIRNTPNKRGAPSIALLKKLGYETHVYSSSRLSYYKMDELLFGSDRHLANQFYSLGENLEEEHWISDQKALILLCDELRANPQKKGRLFIIFLESTHFDYSWPQDTFTPFAPTVDKIDYLKMAFSRKDLEKIKNRYKNAIYYIDSLFGTFEKTLKELNRWEEAVIVITGDHAEEFYEEGNIFHASALSHAQTHIPLYYKFDRKNPLPSNEMTSLTSHIDIFPTLIHYLSGEPASKDLFQGTSIFERQKNPFIVTARYNASRSPCEFFIHNGMYKIVARFNNEKEIFKAKKLHLLSIKNLEEENVSSTPLFIQQEFGLALQSLFPH